MFYHQLIIQRIDNNIPMKQNPYSLFAKAFIVPSTLATLAITLTSSHAAEIYKNDTNLTGLLDPASWEGGVVPGQLDVAVWSNLVATADQSNLPNLATSTSFDGIRIVDPVSNVGFSVNNGRALSVGTSGIDMSAASVDLSIGGPGILRPYGSSTSNYNVASGRTLTINAQFQASSGTTTVNFPGAGAVNINKLAANTSLKLINNGTGIVTIGGTGTSSTSELSASTAIANGGKVIINGPTISTSLLGTYGNSSRSSTFELQAGGVNFDGGVRITGADGSLIKVTDGAFTATTVNLARSSNLALGADAPATSGFVATGGTASIGSLLIGTSNSSASALIDGSAVTVTSTVNLGSGSMGLVRRNTLQVKSGSLTVSGSDGIQMSTNADGGSVSQVRLTGGITTTEAIKFGVAASLADSQGNVEVGPGATLYIGSGGVNVISLNNYIANFNAKGGTIGAKAAWTSTVPLVIDTTSTFKAADAADAAFDITLNAGVSGAGGLTKTGGGTLTLGVVAPSYSGDTTISSGTLSLAQPNANNESSTISIASDAFLNLNFGGNDTVGKLFINGVQQPAGVYEASGNPASNIESPRITGTGTLTVSSSPPSSGFTTWIGGTFANGNTVPGNQQGPNDDPDSDGIDNLTEYALATLDPTVGNGSVGSFANLTLSFDKRQPLAGDISYVIEESTDLGVTDSWDPVSAVNNDTGISYTMPGSAAKNFLRLKVVQN